MEPSELLLLNLRSPVVLAFLLGAVATLVRSDLKFPEELYSALSIYLLLAIGLKGGAELSVTPLGVIAKPLLATLLLGLLTPLFAYAILRRLGRFDITNAAAIAAHYGSVSVVTFTAAITFLRALDVPFEGFMPTLVVILEIPGILVALTIARLGTGTTGAWGEIARELLAGRSILLLLGGWRSAGRPASRDWRRWRRSLWRGPRAR